MEVLVAVAILAVIAGVLLQAHVQALRTESVARRGEMSRFPVETAYSRNTLGRLPTSTQAVDEAGWSMTCSTSRIAGPGSQDTWCCWILSPTDAADRATTLFLQPHAAR